MDTEDAVHIDNGILLSQKENEVMSLAATQMHLGGIILSEVCPTQKDEYYMISVIRRI